MAKTDQLANAAYDLALEIRDGKWDHVEEIHRKPASACSALIDELRRRSPGFGNERYQRALADSLQASR
jgi:hypothetical protein